MNDFDSFVTYTIVYGNYETQQKRAKSTDTRTFRADVELVILIVSDLVANVSLSQKESYNALK